MKLRYNYVLLVVMAALTPLAAASTVLDIITGEADGDYNTRYRLTYTISTNLSDADRTRLETFLSLPLSKGGLDESELAAIKNNVADALVKQESGPHALLSRFQTDWADVAQGMIWRSYIVQKIPELTLELKTKEEIAESLGFLRKLARDPEPDFAATAIMGMDRLHRARPDLITGDDVADATARLLADKNAPAATRISLLQVWADYDQAPALREAKRILVSQNELVLLKMSALVVIGKHGDRADSDLIARYEASPEGRLSTAAAAARKNFAKRHN